MEKTNVNGSFGYVIGLTMVATLGGLLFGYDTAVISGTVGSLEKFFIEPYGLTEAAANSMLGLVVVGVGYQMLVLTLCCGYGLWWVVALLCVYVTLI